MKNLFFERKKDFIVYGAQYSLEDNRFILLYEGELYIHNHLLSPSQLLDYLSNGGDLSILDGLYSLVIYDKETQLLIATQDMVSYYHPLYYYLNQDHLIVSLSLKELIIKSAVKPQIEDGNVSEFLYNGFLTDDRCLLKKIKKVPAMHIFKYNFVAKTANYKKKYYDLKGGITKTTDYFSLLETSIKESLSGYKEINMALSSGFDSNLLLYIVTTLNPKCKINAFCIGSCDGNDETQSVQDICKMYPQVKLTLHKVSPDILESFPQMIFELEDSVFERGIFLQYMMGEAISSKGELPTFFGEGADQLLSSELRMSGDPYYFVGIEQHYPWVYFPYEMLTYIIIKKNGIFLRNRNVNAKYPFIRKEFIQGVNAYRAENGTSKEHYKKYIVDLVDPKVAERLVKRPGSTNLTSLFDENNTRRLFRAAESCRFYSMLTKQPDRDSGNEVDMDNCLKILYLKCFEKIFCDNSDKLEEKNCSLTFEELIGNY